MCKKIIIIDSFSHKSFHEIFNAGFLCCCRFITDKIIYYGSSSSILSIKNLSGINNIIFKKLTLIEGKSKFHTAIRFIQSTFHNIFLLIIIDKNALIIYNYNNIFSLPFLNLFNSLLKKNIVIMCHGEFEVFSETTSYYPSLFWKIYAGNVRKWFSEPKRKINNIAFFVLGENILTNIKPYLPEKIYRCFYTIEHTYIHTENKKMKTPNYPLRFGMIGQVRSGKNIEKYIELVNKFEEEIKNNRITFSIIGSIDTKKEIIQKSGIEIPVKKLDREEFNEKISGLDYALFFYDEQSYRFTASGAYFDTLVLEKPYISLRNNYFEYIADKYGATGLLVDSINEMENTIKEILNGTLILRFDFVKMKYLLSPEQIGQQFKTQLKKMGIL
jgi:hypothetical protein